MAVVVGTNSGFVTTAPTADPSGFDQTAKFKANACKFVAPVGITEITELGWYCGQADTAENTQIGVYSHDSGNNRPGTQLYSSGDFTTTAVGWLRKSGLTIAVTEETTYWLAVQVDNPAGENFINIDFSVDVAEKRDFKNSQASLPSPWGASDNTTGGILAIYALWEGVAGTNTQINIGDAWKEIAGVQINIGDTWKTVEGMQINIGDAWKTIF